MRLGALLVALFVAPAAAAGLDALRWEMRPILIFAPAADHPSVLRQREALEAERSGVADRRLAVYVVAGDAVEPALGAPAADVAAATLRARFGVPHGAFRVVLVGLDGGAKLSEDAPVSAARLFGLVDGMPMRREELRRRN